MKKLILLWFSCFSLALAQPLTLPQSSVGLDSKEGQSIWQSSQDKADYWPLIIHYETQQGPAECGPASSVMVLNSLGLKAPPNTVHPPFNQFTQTNFFSPAVEKVLPRQTLLHQGATLDELGNMLKAWDLRVSIHHAADSNLDEFRSQARQALASGTQFVIINFHRDPLNQEGGAHFSPLAVEWSHFDGHGFSGYTPNRVLWETDQRIPRSSRKERFNCRSPRISLCLE